MPVPETALPIADALRDHYGAERYLREIQSIARLNHPHVLPRH